LALPAIFVQVLFRLKFRRGAYFVSNTHAEAGNGKDHAGKGNGRGNDHESAASILPHDREAEGIVLASLLQQPDPAIISQLSVDDFWSLEYQTLFKAIRKISNEGNPVDFLTLSDFLKRDGSEISLNRILELTEYVPASLGPVHLEILKRLSEQRSLIALTWKIQQDPSSFTYAGLEAEIARRRESGEFRFFSIENKSGAINFPLTSWGAFTTADFGGEPYTIEGLAPDSGLIAFHGRGKDGKSTFLIHACRAIADGRPFLERATVQKPVAYLNYEMGFNYLQKLIKAGGACPDEAYIINRPEPLLQMATVETVMVGLGKPGVMVIDSFRGAFRLQGDAENSSGGAGVVLRALQDLAVKHRWLIIVIHHKNRSAKEGTDAISGTSDWIAAPDVIWTWSRPDKSKPGTLHVEGRMTPVEPFAVQLSPEECVFKGTLEESQEESDRKAIIAVLSAEGQTANDIAEAIQRPPSSVRKRLEALFNGGEVKREGEGKRGDPFLYSKINCAQDNPLGEETKSKSPNRTTEDDAGFDWDTGDQG
jgi:hypothetical protein